MGLPGTCFNHCRFAYPFIGYPFQGYTVGWYPLRDYLCPCGQYFDYFFYFTDEAVLIGAGDGLEY